jgi:glycosyltransferase involved in cell wall biosynthesis
MINKIAIISYTSRQEGCLAGVERFNSLLQKAIGGEIYTGTMFNIPNPISLNSFLVKEKMIDKNTLCIVDGSWGLGIPLEIPVISVVHGTWTEFNYRNHGKLVIDKEQDIMWHRENLKMVAVSNSAAKYLQIHHGVNANKIILNGVNSNIFKPINKINAMPIILHCGRDYNKDGHGVLQQIEKLLEGKFKFKLLYAPGGKEESFYQWADIALQCSYYEGNSYFVLEAMACGLPVVATEAGLFEDMNFLGTKIGLFVPYRANVSMFVSAIESVYKNRAEYNPRKWIEENCSFDLWAKQWKDFLKENYEQKKQDIILKVRSLI